MLDWGAHLVDTAQLAVNDGVPVEVEATGHVPKNSLTTVPVTFDVNYRYSNGVKMNVKSGGNTIRLTGTKGWIGNDGWRHKLKSSDEKILRTEYADGTSKHWNMPPLEYRNFLDCVKSRKPTTYTAETLSQLCTTLHMGVISIYLGEKLKWDAEKEEFTDNAAANAMRIHKPRDDWEKS